MQGTRRWSGRKRRNMKMTNQPVAAGRTQDWPSPSSCHCWSRLKTWQKAWSREEKFPNSISVGMKKEKYEKSNDYAGWDCQNDPKKISSVVREGLTLRRRMTEQMRTSKIYVSTSESGWYWLKKTFKNTQWTTCKGCGQGEYNLKVKRRSKISLEHWPNWTHPSSNCSDQFDKWPFFSKNMKKLKTEPTYNFFS